MTRAAAAAASAPTVSLAADARSLDRLKADAGRDPQGAVRQAAGQFESMFTQMLVKSMRDAMPKSGMWDSAGQGTWQSMLDGQLSQSMAGRPGGLGEMIARQLSRHVKGADGAEAAAAATASIPADSTAAATDTGDAGQQAAAHGRIDPQVRAALALAAARGTGIPLAAGGTVSFAARRPGAASLRADAAAAAADAAGAKPASSRQAAFVQKLWAPAQAAERATGVPATFIVGQAALETGWGRSEMKLPGGANAHNLFGIKAGANWKGATVDATTTEYVDGRAVRTVEKFRAYGSYEEALRDWASLIGNSPRYAGVVRAGGTAEGFAQGLQKAGYATDPYYADKLTRTIQRALHIQRLVI